MRKTIAMVLALLMVLSLAACGSGGEESGVKQFTAFLPSPALRSTATTRYRR